MVQSSMMYGVAAIPFFDDVDLAFVFFLRAPAVVFVTDVHLLLIRDHVFLLLRL